MIFKEMSNSELIEEFLLSKATLSNSTLTSYSSNLKKISAEIGLPFLKIEEKHIANYISQFEYFKTKTSYKTIIKVFFDWLIKQGLVSVNPAQDIKIKNGLKRTQKYMDHGDFEKILSQCQGLRERSIVFFLWYTGVRAKEFRNIKLDDLDFENDIINVRVSKTAKGQRTIDIHPNLKLILTEYLTATMKVRELDNGVSSPYLFLTKHGTKFHKRTIQHLISQLQTSLGFNYGCHDFRRAFVTNVYFATKDIVLAQELAGHKSIETTRNYILNDPRMRADKSRRFKAINF
ncbi:MAG: site-specific integrase [Candidatus Heimdallarchaeota archaeon]|nr:site-specific integrase [Candidatus Heimdallarchaeota archaeon]